MRFLNEQIEAFSAVSHDRNPLHCDQAYAEKTPFGNRVVFGMAVVLRMIHEALEGKPILLAAIQGQFHKPVFLDQEYSLEARIEGDQATVTLKNELDIHVKIRFSFTEIKADPISISQAEAFTPIAKPEEHPKAQKISFSYHCRVEKFQDFLSAFHFQGAFLPFHQMNTLMSLSYLVGMVLPGKQALFSDFNIQWQDPESSTPFPCRLKTEFDERFSRWTIIETEHQFKKFQLHAFSRPKPILIQPKEIKKEIAPGDHFHGKNVLVTGSTRGFGFCLAHGFLQKDAQVFFHGRKKQMPEVDPYIGADLQVAVDAIKKPFLNQPLDILVCNAWPVIRAIQFKDESSKTFLEAKNGPYQMTLNAYQVLQSVLSKQAVVVLISTVYITEALPEFRHYIAAKLALEEAWQKEAKAHLDRQYIIFRLPRMATDQTNVVMDTREKCHPIRAASWLLNLLAASKPSPGKVLIHTWETF